MPVTGGERGTRVPARWRRHAAIATGAVALVAANAGWASSAPVPPANPGFGNSSGNAIAIVPETAGLPFNVTMGGTIATHQNLVSLAQAQWFNLGLVGSALAAETCDGGAPPFPAEDQPQPTRVSSRDPGANEGVTAVNGEGSFTDFARASSRPFAESTSTVAPVVLPGVVAIEGGRTQSTTGVDGNGLPLATAVADISRLSLAGGLVVLGGLHWEATSPYGVEPTGSFTIGTLSIAGVPFPATDPADALQLANDVVANLGFRVAAPSVHFENDVLFVDPLEFSVVPNESRDTVSGLILRTIQPARESAFGALLDAYCNSAGAITVVDIMIGALSGGGSFGLQLGGVRTTLREIPDAAGFGSGTKLPAVEVPSLPTVSLPPVNVAVPTVPPAPVRTEVRQLRPVADDSNDRDAARWVAVGALLLGVLLVEGDRRTLHRQQAGIAGEGG